MVQLILQKTNAHLVTDFFNENIKNLPSMGQAVASTLVIQIIPIFFIYAMNFCFLSSSKTRDATIYILISFAIGGLLGDVFFHTLPHLNEASHDHSGHSHGDHSHGEHGHTHDPK